MIRQLSVAISFIVILSIIGCSDESISQKTMENGKKIYNTYCLSCHMEDAMGVPRLNPPLAGSELLLKEKTKPIRIVLRGSEELKGGTDSEYKNTMMALPSLSDQEIADVLNYARNSFGNKAPKINESDVKNERAKLKLSGLFVDNAIFYKKRYFSSVLDIG